jgi:hypothetical protein
MTEQEIVITPDPQILQVLTYLEMSPINSLCELIDNSIDALSTLPNGESALINVELPTRREVEEGNARIRIRDNGPGMTIQQVQNSLRAGYSSKRRHGTLGLFGVGFNIATGKLGRVARITTARAEDDYAITTHIDILSLRRSGDFRVKAVQIPKPDGFSNGTVVDITDPWTSGNQNHGFMMKLVSLGLPKIISQLGRIYGTILQQRKIRIVVGEDSIEPFHHCTWADHRYVEHQKHGRIPAVFRFTNNVIHTYRKCAQCDAVIPEGDVKCPVPGCSSTSIITQEERITGWVGIQRYLDASHFGLDLIRNGRAIRILEKEPFFIFHDLEKGEPILDYPIDNREGRIVGEIHLDHVPVDPAKRNFELSSPEWRRAVEFLRGNTSLQPERVGAQFNQSPIFKLYQGYRKVRTPGKRSMTMGKWLPGSNEPRALNKGEIEELRKRFESREPGYFDDSEWWKLVENADNKPVTGLRKCPSCHLEANDGLDECPHCAHIFNGKECINRDCQATISHRTVECPHCGSNQIPEVKEPWICEVCQNSNQADDTNCGVCEHIRGAVNPVSKEGLRANSHIDESLSVPGLSIQLPSGENTSPIDISTYRSSVPIVCYRKDGTKQNLPLVRFVGNEIELYFDPNHHYFSQSTSSLEQQVATEIAMYLTTYYASQVARNPAFYSVANFTHQILRKYWPEKFSAAGTEAELEELFSSIKQKLVDTIGTESAEVYDNLPQEEKSFLASELVRRGRDVSELSDIKTTGHFLLFLRPSALVSIFRANPKLFFDGKVWSVTYASIPQLQPEAGERLQAQLKSHYLALLDIVAIYAERRTDNAGELELARAACKLLWTRMEA